MIYVWMVYIIGFEMTLVWYGVGEFADRRRARREPEFKKQMDDEMSQFMPPTNRNIAVLILLTALLWPLMMLVDWTGWGEE